MLPNSLRLLPLTMLLDSVSFMVLFFEIFPAEWQAGQNFGRFRGLALIHAGFQRIFGCILRPNDLDQSWSFRISLPRCKKEKKKQNSTFFSIRKRWLPGSARRRRSSDRRRSDCSERAPWRLRRIRFEAFRLSLGDARRSCLKPTHRVKVWHVQKVFRQ